MWDDILFWSHLSTIVMGVTAIIMVVFAWINFRAAHKNRIDAAEALEKAKQSLEKSELLETQLEENVKTVENTVENGALNTLLVYRLILSIPDHAMFEEADKVKEQMSMLLKQFIEKYRYNPMDEDPP